MGFGLINDNQHVFEIVEQQDHPVRLSDGVSDEGLLDYFFHIKLHEDFQQPSNPQLLQTITIPNYFPANELLSKGWLPGRYIFEKNWTEVINTLSIQIWNITDISNVVEGVKDHIRKRSLKSDKHYVEEQIPQGVKNQLCKAYMCHLWNSIVTQRLETLGPNPQMGDLIYCSNPFGGNKSGLPKRLPTYYKFQGNIKPGSILMPIPGKKSTLYPDNEAIMNMYKTLIPRFGNKWFTKRICDFAMDMDYRPIVCQPTELEYSRISKNEFSLKFKLPKTNSYENILRGLKACIQLSTVTVTSATLTPLETASATVTSPAAISFCTPGALRNTTSLRSTTMKEAFPIGKNMNTAGNIKVAAMGNNRTITDCISSLERRNVSVEKEEVTVKRITRASTREANSSTNKIRVLAAENDAAQSEKRSLPEETKRTKSPKEKHLERRVEVAKLNTTNLKDALMKETVKAADESPKKSITITQGIKLECEIKTEKCYSLPDPSVRRKQIEVITLSDSDDSEDEPVFKKRKIKTYVISDSSGSDTEPNSDNLKSFTVTGSQSTSGNIQFTVPNNIKQEKDAGQHYQYRKATQNLPCANVKIEGGQKENIINSSHIKCEPTFDMPYAEHNQLKSFNGQQTKVQQGPVTVKMEL